MLFDALAELAVPSLALAAFVSALAVVDLLSTVGFVTGADASFFTEP